MQTFLPYPSFVETARCLDNRRLGKQRVEAKQILIALGFDVGEHRGNAESRWRSHPAVAMWRGAENWLALYAVDVCCEWRRRGFRDSLCEQFMSVRDSLILTRGFVNKPRWIGCAEFHESHQSNLMRKLPAWYGRFGWGVGDDLPYVWPASPADKTWGAH